MAASGRSAALSGHYACFSSLEPLDSPRKLLAVILDKEYSVWYDIVWPLRAAALPETALPETALHSAARAAVDSALLQLDFTV